MCIQYRCYIDRFHQYFGHFRGILYYYYIQDVVQLCGDISHWIWCQFAERILFDIEMELNRHGLGNRRTRMSYMDCSVCAICEHNRTLRDPVKLKYLHRVNGVRQNEFAMGRKHRKETIYVYVWQRLQEGVHTKCTCEKLSKYFRSASLTEDFSVQTRSEAR